MISNKATSMKRMECERHTLIEKNGKHIYYEQDIHGQNYPNSWRKVEAMDTNNAH